MTDRDIVERLRFDVGSRPGGICEEAAAEIERLRSVATAEMKLREGNFETICDLLDEVKRLRARVAFLEDEIAVRGGLDPSRWRELLAERVAELEGRNYKLTKWLQWALDHCDDSPEWNFGTTAADHMRNLVKGEDAPLPDEYVP